jgi:hypothetical protein
MDSFGLSKFENDLARGLTPIFLTDCSPGPCDPSNLRVQPKFWALDLLAAAAAIAGSLSITVDQCLPVDLPVPLKSSWNVWTDIYN